jgi:hypothetical protein
MPTSSRNVLIRKETVGQKLDRFIESIYHEAFLVKEKAEMAMDWRLVVIIILSISSLLIIGKFCRVSLIVSTFRWLVRSSGHIDKGLL